MGKIESIAKNVEKKKEAPILKLIGSKDKSVQLAAIEALGKVGKDDSFNALIVRLTDDDADIREAAAKALGAMGNDHARAHLQHALSKENNAKVEAALKHSIEQLRNARD